MQLRSHLMMSYKGRPSWPPRWSWMRSHNQRHRRDRHRLTPPASVWNLISDQIWLSNELVPVLKVTCEIEEAKMLLDLANRIYPDAVPDIRRAIG